MSQPSFITPIPYRDPPGAFQPFADAPGSLFFDSADAPTGQGRWSYVLVDPARTVRADGRVSVDGVAVAGDPFSVLRREFARVRRPAGAVDAALPPFQGGLAGFLAYEAGRHLERLPLPAPDDLGLPEMLAGAYDTVAAFDTVARRAFVIASEFPGAPAGRAGPEARAEALARRIQDAPALTPECWLPAARWVAEMPERTYEDAVAAVVDYIRAGDIFQANLTQRFVASRPEGLGAFPLYQRLRSLSPAPHAGYVNLGDGAAILSASPERFLRVDADGRIETRPIKGTRPRGATPEADRALKDALLASAKDRAENLMIVDLLRNDLGRVAEIGSVRVPELCTPETFAQVHHLVSVVEARLRPGLSPVDLLAAAFPGGSITGAPKIRAMEIIAELERSRRGAYCGTLFWMGCDGAMDSSILIRTMTATPDRLIAQAGAGIVADSDPAAEYAECLTKAKAMLAAAAGREAAA